MIGKLRVAWQTGGPRFLLRELRRKLLAPRARCFDLVASRVNDRRGLEIGGPSEVFGRGGPLPLYARVGALDNCNFARETTWEGRIEEGGPYRFDPDRAPGRQYIAEATRLMGIADASYEFLLSSHTLEHSANPLAALAEWRRVLVPGGTLALLLPHRDATFDHRRPPTPLRHLVEDLERGTGEDDRTHLEEILALHDLGRDPGAGDAAAFRVRAERNFENRCLHQHVFDTRHALEMVDRGGWSLLAAEALHPCHIVIIAEAPGAGLSPDNAAALAAQLGALDRSPFRSDRESARATGSPSRSR